MFMYFYDWIAMLTNVLVFTDLIDTIVAYLSGPVGTVFDFAGFSNVALIRFGVLALAFAGYWMLETVHKKAITREGLTLIQDRLYTL